MTENIDIYLGDGIDFKIVFAGSFLKDEGKKEEKLVEYNDSIKLQAGSHFFKLTATALSRLAVALQDREIRAVLQERFLEEKARMPEADGF